MFLVLQKSTGQHTVPQNTKLEIHINCKSQALNCTTMSNDCLPETGKVYRPSTQYKDEITCDH